MRKVTILMFNAISDPLNVAITYFIGFILFVIVKVYQWKYIKTRLIKRRKSERMKLIFITLIFSLSFLMRVIVNGINKSSY